MSRIKSIASLTKSLEYATKRQAYYATIRPGKTTVEPNPKDLYIYTCSTYVIGATAAVLKIQACTKSIEEFTLAALGLKEGADPTAAGAARPPRGFRPAKVKGTVGADTPTVGTSPVSGRRIVKYSADSSGSAKANYTAPISGATDKAQRDAFQAVVVATASKFKTAGYGRLSFTPEYLPTSG